MIVVDFPNFDDSMDLCGNGPKEELEMKPQPLMGSRHRAVHFVIMRGFSDRSLGRMDVLIHLAPGSSDRLQDPWKYGGCSTLHCDTGSSWISSALPGQYGLMQLPGLSGPKIGSA